jgi:hypothetical protein
MLSNIKLPHWLMVALGLLAILLPWLLKQESTGVFVVPSWVIPAENGIILVLGYLGFISPSVSPNTNAVAMAKFAKRQGAGIAAILIGSLYFGGDTACTAPASPSSVVGPTIQTSVCILTQVAVDQAAGKTWEATVADVILTCGTDAVTIATVWDAHVKAEVSEGVVPKYGFPTDGGVH